MKNVRATFTLWTPSSYVRDCVMKGDLPPAHRRLWRNFLGRSRAPTNESIFSSEIRDEPFLRLSTKLGQLRRPGGFQSSGKA